MASFPVSDLDDLEIQTYVRNIIDCPDFVLMTDDQRLGFMFDIPHQFNGSSSDIFLAIIAAQSFQSKSFFRF